MSQKRPPSDAFLTGKLLPTGYRLFFHPTLPSTMDEAHRLAQEGAASGTLVLAETQTKGRGRLGKEWSSFPENVHLSCVLRPRLSYEKLSWLSFSVAVAAGHALLPFLKDDDALQYKWPNDVLLAGQKIGGVLIEVGPESTVPDKPSWVVFGLGMNIRAAPKNLDVPVTSLLDQGIDITREDFLSFFCTEFQSVLALVEEEGFETVRAMWLSRAWGMGRSLSVEVGNGIVYEGVAVSVTRQGALLLKKKSGEKIAVPTGYASFSTSPPMCS
jgi:BirA family biotin operon repressor/biotin-[acetyl-CoA-carboxylase] ligase